MLHSVVTNKLVGYTFLLRHMKIARLQPKIGSMLIRLKRFPEATIAN